MKDTVFLKEQKVSILPTPGKALPTCSILTLKVNSVPEMTWILPSTRPDTMCKLQAEEEATVI